ncbi:hypothetical protein K438DRAFT_1541803, partial [Mycena galopus ATCC 62051]
PRRPLSPSSLRDVDLTHMSDSALHPRRYPAPPTGHDLMALFPPPAPDSFPELRPGPTSGYFQRQERAFFAQAGKEIVRVRVDVDVDPESSAMSVKVQSQQQRGPAPRSWPPSTSTPGAPHPRQHTRGPSVPVTPDGDGFRTDDPDEAWRRPMPYNERRRAGKHTRRVVV